MNQKAFQNHHQQSTNNYVEQDQNQQQAGKLTKSTPLALALRINGSYYVSYKRQQFWQMTIRSVLWIAVNIFLISFLRSFQNVSEFVKNIIEFSLIAQVILHVIICFMDAGTLDEDEQETYQESRIFCVNCSLYRLRKTKHCIFCNKCVRNYDHHCSVFGKCIGRRNLVPFWIFIIITALQMPAFIVILIIQISGSS